jgi:hypothetical protein
VGNLGSTNVDTLFNDACRASLSKSVLTDGKVSRYSK